ncbi:MAG: GNAT family N-acetyltransferase [Chitinivibrionales bacterium]|nr:GNAT family N-acetyltransferase [Chitinivibrionales bacterium]
MANQKRRDHRPSVTAIHQLHSTQGYEPMGVEIREIGKQELLEYYHDLLPDVESNDSFTYANSSHRDWLQRKIDHHFGRGCRVFSAFSGTDPIGFITAIFETNPFMPGYSEILELGVIANSRRMGVGTKLIEHVVKISSELGLCTVLVSTYAAEYGTICFYGRNSFHPVATIDGMNGPKDRGQLYMSRRVSE